MPVSYAESILRRPLIHGIGPLDEEEEALEIAAGEAPAYDSSTLDEESIEPRSNPSRSRFPGVPRRPSVPNLPSTPEPPPVDYPGGVPSSMHPNEFGQLGMDKPGPAGRKPTPALDALRSHNDRIPAPDKPNLGQKIAAVGAGVVEGLVNSGQRTRINMQPFIQEMSRPGYARAMEQWQIEDEKLKRNADLETREDLTDQSRKTQEARRATYEAQTARANRPSTPIAQKPAAPKAYAPEEVEERQRYADSKGWTEENTPGLRSWVLTGSYHEPKPKAEPAGPKATGAYAHIPEAEREDFARRELNAKIAKAERQPQGRGGGGGGDDKPKPMSAYQIASMKQRLNQEVQQNYAQAEEDRKRKILELRNSYRAKLSSADAGARAQSQQEFDQMLAQIDDDHLKRKQGIENYYKMQLEEIAGAPQSRFDYTQQKRPPQVLQVPQVPPQVPQSARPTAPQSAAPMAPVAPMASPAPSPGAPVGGKQVTRDKVAAFAQRRGMSYQQAKQIAESEGYRVLE